MGISVGQHGLTVDGETIPIYAGTIHYWQHPPVMWEPLLRSIQALGFHMIETYIPWGVHETAPGRFDFGQDNPANDLDRFLRLCEQLNLWVCVRPAPVSNAELTFWGCPEHVLSDPAVQARTSQDTPAIVDYPPQPFAVPSYASERFYTYIAAWFDELCPRLIPHLHPNGRIIACQVDNELTYFFRTDAYYLDYHPDAVQQYREMLRRDYRTIDALNYAYHSAYADFDQIPPPRDCVAQTASDLPYYLDWVRYKEQQLTAALVRLADMLRQRGISVPLYHDLTIQTSPVDQAAAETHLDFTGANLYARPSDYERIARRLRYQLGHERLPFVPEYGAGMWSHWLSATLSPQEHEFFALCGLMHGLQAINYYMLVERDRWQGSPIARDNRLRPGYADFHIRLSRLIRETDLLNTTKTASVLVLYNYELGRWVEACTTLPYAFMGALGVPSSFKRRGIDFGLAHDPVFEGDRHQPENWVNRVMGCLESAQVEFNTADTQITLERMQAYATVFVPSIELLSADLQAKLRAYAGRGGRLIVGPVLPTLDDRLQPCALLETSEQIRVLTNGADADQHITPEQIKPVTHDNPALRLTIREGSRRFCFLANPTNTDQSFVLSSPAHLRGLSGVEGDYTGETLTLPAYTLWIWEMLP